MPAAVDEIYNYRRIDERLATSGQPSEEELAAIAQAGYSVVINLALHDDPRYSLRDEAGTVIALGMQYVHIPVAFDDPREAQLLAFFDAMDRHRAERVWAHCAANKRVASFFGLYRALCCGSPLREAFTLQQEIWQPNAAWQTFIDAMLMKRVGARSARESGDRAERTSTPGSA
jgi:uncharacterized protein (TIGR01244 family)